MLRRLMKREDDPSIGTEYIAYFDAVDESGGHTSYELSYLRYLPCTLPTCSYIGTSYSTR